MNLEKMDAFFAARLDGYDEHMLTAIKGAKAFYPYDTPLTVAHEVAVLWKVRFSDVQVLQNWEATYTILAR